MSRETLEYHHDKHHMAYVTNGNAALKDSPLAGKSIEEICKVAFADKIAPLVAYLASDLSVDVTNQIFSVRKNEILLFDKPRPVRSMVKLEGWTPTAIAEELIPAFRPSFARADEVSAHVFPYDPV